MVDPYNRIHSGFSDLWDVNIVACQWRLDWRMCGEPFAPDF